MKRLLLWHCAEEIEHKAVAFGVLQAVRPSYAIAEQCLVGADLSEGRASLMIVLAAILLSLAALAALVWLGQHYMISLEARGGFVLNADYAGSPSDAPLISVVVAAKEEEENIGPCLRTMLDQDYPNYEVLVVNDRSRDRTPQIIDEIAAGDPRLTALHIEHLPEGWCGKNSAMQRALRADYDIEARGSTEIKGKGRLGVFFLHGPAAASRHHTAASLRRDHDSVT